MIITVMKQRKIISGLNPRELIHPEDRKMMDRLTKIPKFTELLNNTVVKYDSIVTDVLYDGHGYSITEESAPSLYNQYKTDCEIFGIKDMPMISSMWAYLISSDTTGGKNPRISLSSGAIDLLTPAELDFLIGHELGHIIVGHKPYHVLLELLYSPLIDQVDSFSIASVIRMPMLEWYRISHYSADRAGLLCCQDINAAITAMIKMSGCPIKYYDQIDIHSFLKQGDVFEQQNQKFLDSIMSSFILRASSMPWMVVRAKLLYDWYKSGEYSKILENV